MECSQEMHSLSLPFHLLMAFPISVCRNGWVGLQCLLLMFTIILIPLKLGITLVWLYFSRALYVVLIKRNVFYFQQGCHIPSKQKCYWSGWKVCKLYEKKDVKGFISLLSFHFLICFRNGEEKLKERIFYLHFPLLKPLLQNAYFITKMQPNSITTGLIHWQNFLLPI